MSGWRVSVTAGKLLLVSRPQITRSTTGIGPAVYLVGQHAQRGTVDCGGSIDKLLQSTVCLSRVGGPNVVDELSLEGSGSRIPVPQYTNNIVSKNSTYYCM